MQSISTTPQTIVAYYRVSTQKQGTSGLGLEAQQAAVKAAYPTAKIVEFIEVESGRKTKRVQLAAAAAAAKQNGCELVVAKLDRLARNVAFLFALKESGVQFVALDMPTLNTLTLGILATLAQHEAELISSRTKAALAAKKARGAQLGTPANLTAAARAAGRVAHTANAANNVNTKLARGYAKLLSGAGNSLRAVASKLNEQGYKTARGGQYTATQVSRLVG